MKGSRRHPVVADYFAQIDTSNKAYVLGFFMADGCIESTCELGFVQHQSDIAVLEFVRRELQGGAETYPMKTIPAGKHTSRSLRIGSTRMVADLKALGFARRKSETCLFPGIDPAFHAPLLLGLFDGDGSIYSNLPKRYTNRCWFLDWAGTKPVLEAVHAILAERCALRAEKHIPLKKRACHSLQYAGNEVVERIGHFLYDTAPPAFFLARKRARFQELYDRPAQAPHPYSLRTCCPLGHEYTEANTYRDPKTFRRGCRICRTLAMQRFRARIKQANL